MTMSSDKLSPHYRADSPDGLDPDLKAYLDDAYLPSLQNLDKTQRKYVIVFSGGNAVGKSTLAQKIADTYGALVLENDAVKRCILKRSPDLPRDELNKLTWQYTMDLYSRLDSLTANGLVVRDGVIDWYYDRILPVFLKQGYKLIVIAFDLSREKSSALVAQRGDTPTTQADRLLKLLEDHEIHMQRFRNEYRPDIVLNDDNLFDHDHVIKQLKPLLA